MKKNDQYHLFLLFDLYLFKVVCLIEVSSYLVNFHNLVLPVHADDQSDAYDHVNFVHFEDVMPDICILS